MEFLVSCVIDFGRLEEPGGREELIAAEAERAHELAELGAIRRLWRVPGSTANRGIWEAPDATALHEALASLPLFPLMEITVEALALHPSDPGAGG